MSETKKRLVYGSLFAGIGGLDLGFDRAGMKCRWQVEIDPWARSVLAKHWPEVPKHDDIRTFRDPLPVDILAGGFPCQDISFAGKQEGLSGERSGLFWEFERLIREIRPEGVVLENVAGLLDRGLGEVLGALAKIGYDAEWDCFPAAAVGADQIRERVFVLAYPQHGRLSKRWGTEATRPSLLGRSRVCEHESPGGTFQADQSLSDFARGQSHWDREPGVGRVAHGVSGRLDRAKRIKGLGNSIVPQVAEWIGRRIVAAFG